MSRPALRSLVVATMAALIAVAPTPAQTPRDDPWEGRLLGDADIVERYVEQKAKEAFGGWSIERDPAQGLYLLAAFTRDRERHEAALKPSVSHPDRLRVVQVARTIAQLDALAKQIRRRDFASLKAEGFRVVSLDRDFAANAVSVGVITRREDAQAFFAGRYGGAVRVTVIARERHRLESTAANGYTVAPSGRRLRVYWHSNRVYRPVRVEVRETRRHIAVRIVERAPNGPVTMAGAFRRRMVPLDRPLDRRRVIDAATGRAMRRYKRPPKPWSLPRPFRPRDDG